MILGLDRPTAGRVTVNGKPLRASMRRRCARSARCWRPERSTPGRSAYNHLLALAQTHGIPQQRVERGDRPGRTARGGKQARGHVLARHGPAARHRRRRCWATRRRCILDEPVERAGPGGHPLDPQRCCKGLAAEGRTVFVSSHLMSEMALTADHLIVIGRGRLIADTSVAEFIARRVEGRSSACARREARAAARRCSAAGRRRRAHDADDARGRRADGRRRSGDAAAAAGIVLHELTPQQASLEEAFMELTREPSSSRPHAASEARGMSTACAATAAARAARDRRSRSPRDRLRVDEAEDRCGRRVCSLLAAVVLTIGLAILASTVIVARTGATDEPGTTARTSTRSTSALVGVAHRPARDRRPRRAGDHRRVLDRDDPRDADRGARSGCRCCGRKDGVFARGAFALMVPVGADRLLRRARRSSRGTAHQLAFSHPGVARAVIGAALYLTRRRRASRSATRRDRAQHGRRDRGLRRRSSS